MAELYFSQGHIDKAVDVYRKLLRGGTENERARLRLVELEEMLRRGAPVHETAVVAGATSRQERRAAIEHRIARLEQLLAVIQRR